MRLPLVDVAVAIVRQADGRVLLAERTPRQLGAGLWELPGGKIDPGESAAEAAVRELAEEIGILAHRLRPAVCYEHAFRTRRLRLQFFHVESWSGTPRGVEGQRLAWIDPARPEAVGPLQPSNERCLLALGLPDLYADCRLTEAASISEHLNAAQTALAAGARLLLVGGAGLTMDQRVGLVRRVDGLARPRNARVVLAGSLLEARRCGVLGLHSAARDLGAVATRPPVALWIVECHGADDLARATAAGADAAVVSPMLATDRQDGRPAPGWEAFGRLIRAATIPVYVGGLTMDARAEALAHGAVGMACALPTSKAAMRKASAAAAPDTHDAPPAMAASHLRGAGRHQGAAAARQADPRARRRAEAGRVRP